MGDVRILPLSVAKAKLSELVDEVMRTHEHVTVTRNGSAAVVLVSADEWDAVQETLYWQSRPGLADDIREAREALADESTLDEAAVRARYAR